MVPEVGQKVLVRGINPDAFGGKTEVRSVIATVHDDAGEWVDVAWKEGKDAWATTRPFYASQAAAERAEPSSIYVLPDTAGKPSGRDPEPLHGDALVARAQREEAASFDDRENPPAAIADPDFVAPSREGADKQPPAPIVGVAEPTADREKPPVQPVGPNGKTLERDDDDAGPANVVDKQPPGEDHGGVPAPQATRTVPRATLADPHPVEF